MSVLTAAVKKNAARIDGTDYLLLVLKASIEYDRESRPRTGEANHYYAFLDYYLERFKREVYRKRIRPEQMQTELLQIAAVAIRAIEDLTLNNVGQASRLSPSSK